MSRTIVRYGPEDIDKNDPVHTFLMTTILLMSLNFEETLAMGIRKVEPGEDALVMMNRLIADVLNMATDQGISITKSEIPAAFLNVRAPLT